MDPIVECSADAGGPVPRRFGRRGAMHRVMQVVDRWPGRGHCYFRVRTDEGIEYILRHDERAGRWQIHFLDAAMRSADTRRPTD